MMRAKLTIISFLVVAASLDSISAQATIDGLPRIGLDSPNEACNSLPDGCDRRCYSPEGCCDVPIGNLDCTRFWSTRMRLISPYGDMVPPQHIDASTCPNSPATGTVRFVTEPDLLIHLTAVQNGAAGEIGFEDGVPYSNMQGVSSGPTASLFMNGVAGVGTVNGVPIPVAGGVEVRCSKATADICISNTHVCIEAGAKIACEATAWGGVYISGVLVGSFQSEAHSAFPC
jgi:hypothetical protein